MLKKNGLAFAIATVLGTTAAVAGAAESTGGIEEIVVTAQRRSESIQNVPITIQAISADTLSKLSVSTFDDVIKMLPNVTFGANGPGQGNIFMRGLSAGFAGGQSSASIAPFPNVATYLDDQSLTFPSRNLDIYMVDMERVEVLEGPQGTLFGGGAEAGALRYITNKPKLGVTEGRAEASYGTTAHGDPNSAISAVLNLPLSDKLAVRGVFYNDRRGGYIDNVPTTFTRNPAVDTGPSAYSSSYPAQLDTYNNYSIAKRAQNPVTYQGFRLSGLYQINDDWSALIQQSYQSMDAEGMSVQMPIGIGLTPLKPLEETSFFPAWNKDKASSTAWTLNGKAGDLKLVYTGAYLTRHVDQSMDYSNYARTPGGFYYSCVGGHTPGSPLGGPSASFPNQDGPDNASNFGAPGPAHCYSPIMGWHDTIESKHQSHEFRVSTPDEWRIRAVGGVFWEDFQIKDSMDFMQKTIPSCTPDNLAAALAGGPICLGNVTPVQAAINPNTRNDYVNFGEDLERGYKQTAVFGSLDFDLIPKVLTFTVGTRYYKYTEQEVGSQYGTGSSCVNVANGLCMATPIGGGLDPDPVTGVRNQDFHKATFSGFKSRANITWHPTVDSMIYYTFSQGYRPGAFNRTTKGVAKVWINNGSGAALANGTTAVKAPSGCTAAAPVCADGSNWSAYDTIVTQFVKPLSYSPDTLINNEVGFKTQFFNRRLQVNGSIYQMDWKNVQTQIYNPPVYGNTTFGLNGPDYRVKGFELQITALATENLTLTGSVSYNDAKQSNSPCITAAGVTFYTPKNPTAAGQCITQVRAGGTNIAIPNPLGSEGDTPAFSPKMQYNLRARYDWTAGEYKAFALVGLNHTDSMNNTPSSFPSGEGILIPSTTWLRFNMPSYNTYDASVGVTKDAWEVTLYGQNLSNENVSTFTSTGQFIRAEVPLRPRVLGVKIGLKF